MALARVQTSIVNNLRDLGALDEEKSRKIIFGEDMSGETLDKLLITDYKVSEFPIADGKRPGIRAESAQRPRPSGR